MSKSKCIFTCQSCGAQKSRWEGRCSDCGEWNTLVEEKVQKDKSKGWVSISPNDRQIMNLDQSAETKVFPRVSTQNSELDRVLGGGLVQGSFVLLGGSPGVGKSTLLLQTSKGLSSPTSKVLYVSGEESVHQTASRAQRMKINSPYITVLSENNLSEVLSVTDEIHPSVLIIDSIQTIHTKDIESAPGSVSQVRECAARLLHLAKSKNISVILVGHITKDGSLAGPKVLEHMVDCVLAFEGDVFHQFRMIRAVKNRFGPANELGVFKMSAAGLEEVQNPSEIFLEERSRESFGSVVFASMEGTRPLLCEVQALSLESQMSMPRRTTVGVEINRLHMMAAIIERHLQIDLSREEIYINVVGGLKLEETSSDLALCAALLSSKKKKTVPVGSVFFGEVGLTGEIRGVNFIEERIKESLKLGFKEFFLPQSNKKIVDSIPNKSSGKFHFLKNIVDLADAVLGRVRKDSSRPDLELF